MNVNQCNDFSSHGDSTVCVGVGVYCMYVCKGSEEERKRRGTVMRCVA